MKKLKDFLRQLMLLYKRFLYLIARLTVKTDEQTVFFEAFQGRSVSCSPKALYEEMLRNSKYRDYQFFWSLRNTDRRDFLVNERTGIVKFESFAYYKALARAKYWIFNSNPRPFLKPAKEQVYVQTWHGTPLKKIGCDVAKSGNAMTKLSDIVKIYTTEAEKISYMVSPSDYCTEKFISAFHLKAVKKEDRVLTLGYPRNDSLFTTTKKQCTQIKERLGIPENKKVILYAPTFRDNNYSAKEGFRLANYMDFDRARQQLGEDYVILFRAHYFISGRIDLTPYKGFVFDVSDVEDINELYVISDLLITDYSSVFFDYANLMRPMVFYMCDYEQYKNELRDFYFDVKELPGPIIREEAQLLDAVKQLSEHFEVDEKYRNFHDKYNYLDSADTSRRALEKIIG